MKAIIIGAGRGRRLKHLTDEIPKTMVPIVGRPMLEHIREAIDNGGFTEPDTVFICGYRSEVIRAAHPGLHYVENTDWQNNNILLSLMYARDHLVDGFVSTYSDIVYRPDTIAKACATPDDLVLVCDTDWRRRYEGRSEHPETDAEKLVADADGVVTLLSRTIPSGEATGEFIGVLKATARGAAQLVAAYDEVVSKQELDTEFREGRTLRKAYLIDLLQWMIEHGTPMRAMGIDGGYMEIDTTQDAALAEGWWNQSEPD